MSQLPALQQLAREIQELNNKRICAACTGRGCHSGLFGKGPCKICSGSGQTQLSLAQQDAIQYQKATIASYPAPSPAQRQQEIDQQIANAITSNNGNPQDPATLIAYMIFQVQRLRARRICPSCNGNGAFDGKLGNYGKHDPCPVCDGVGYSFRTVDEDYEKRTAYSRGEQQANQGPQGRVGDSRTENQSPDIQQLAREIQELNNKRICAACTGRGSKYGMFGKGKCAICDGSGQTQLSLAQQDAIQYQKATLASYPAPSTTQRQQEIDQQIAHAITSNNNGNPQDSATLIAYMIFQVQRLRARRICPSCNGNGAFDGKLGNYGKHDPCPVCDGVGYSFRTVDEDYEKRTAHSRGEQQANQGGDCCVVQ